MGATLNSGGGRGRRGRRGGGGGTVDINVTPLVDVMLVLLIIFMVTAPMLTAGVEVDLPDSKAGALQSKEEEPLSVSIKSGGVLYIQESKIQADSLIPKLRAIAEQKKGKFNTVIFVRSDRSISYGDVMKVVGDISAAGFKKVALITENTPSKTL
jgi:biopolymer transport protein TolR